MKSTYIAPDTAVHGNSVFFNDGITHSGNGRSGSYSNDFLIQMSSHMGSSNPSCSCKHSNNVVPG